MATTTNTKYKDRYKVTVTFRSPKKDITGDKVIKNKQEKSSYGEIGAKVTKLLSLVPDDSKIISLYVLNMSV